jgi:hypothetical protein
MDILGSDFAEEVTGESCVYNFEFDHASQIARTRLSESGFVVKDFPISEWLVLESKEELVAVAPGRVDRDGNRVNRDIQVTVTCTRP